MSKNKKKLTKAQVRKITVSTIAIVLAALFVITGLMAALPGMFL